jgi:hypothetical protein
MELRRIALFAAGVAKRVARGDSSCSYGSSRAGYPLDATIGGILRRFGPGALRSRTPAMNRTFSQWRSRATS